MSSYLFSPVAVIESVFRDRFGVPRQPGLVPAARARLRLLAPFDRPECLAGIDTFSHLWLVFVFHRTAGRGWHPTVRPPRLGGNRRTGVFASRSTHRPNPLGLSVVRLLRVLDGVEGPGLELGGVDLVHGTPVLDIKPYLPWADRVDDACAGAFGVAPGPVPVVLEEQARAFLREHLECTGEDLETLLLQVLAQDPRPAYQHDGTRRYGMSLGPVEVGFRVTGSDEGTTLVRVESVRPSGRATDTPGR